jgi:hypothetical protein
MRLNRTLLLGFALVLTLMLPLQGYTAMPECGRDARADSTAAHGVAATSAHHCGAGAVHRHNCGSCCSAAAIAVSDVHWMAPLRAVPEIPSAAPSSAPTVILDRLDRPPRSSHA